MQSQPSSHPYRFSGPSENPTPPLTQQVSQTIVATDVQGTSNNLFDNSILLEAEQVLKEDYSKISPQIAKLIEYILQKKGLNQQQKSDNRVEEQDENDREELKRQKSSPKRVGEPSDMFLPSPILSNNAKTKKAVVQSRQQHYRNPSNNKVHPIPPSTLQIVGQMEEQPKETVHSTFPKDVGSPTAVHGGQGLGGIINGFKEAIDPQELHRIESRGVNVDLWGMESEKTKRSEWSYKESLRSSLDYIDVNLNDAMKLTGNPALTGRGKRFFQKAYREDQWSEDESIYVKQMKMPNVKATKHAYEKELGLKLKIVTQNATGKQNNQQNSSEDSLEIARNMLPEEPFYKILNKDRIQIIDDYYDRCPLLELRKQMMRWRVWINRGAQIIMKHSLFESISISVIAVNSLFLAMDDPLRDPSETPYYMILSDDIFQYLYTIEMVVKIVSLGFILNKGSYLRDAWNILDFVIIASGYMGMFLEGSGVNLSALRSFRVIRPLRTISSIQGLRVIVSSLINAIPLLRDSILVLLFFFLVFAIAGCQLFTGALKNRCFHEDTGVIDPNINFCGGGDSCTPGYYCGKSNENPANGATNFDNVMFAMLQVFQVVSMEGWTTIMVSLMQSVGTWIFIYFYPIIFIGTFFLLNLTLAVIKAKFTEEMKNKQENAPPKKKKKLDDAPLSSEDEDAKALELKGRLDLIKETRNMSPRSKRNLVNKLRIEHLIWRIDTMFEKRTAEHKIVERKDDEQKIAEKTEALETQAKTAPDELPQEAKTQGGAQQKLLTAVDKMTIIESTNGADQLLAPPLQKSKSRVIRPLNYSQMFYSNKSQSFLDMGISILDMKQVYNGRGNEGMPDSIRRIINEEKFNLELDNLQVPSKHMKSGSMLFQGLKSPKGSKKDLLTTAGGNAQNTLSTSFLLKKNLNSQDQTHTHLQFAGINGENSNLTLRSNRFNQGKSRSNQKRNTKVNKEALYEHITKNFDIYEFIDESTPRVALIDDDEFQRQDEEQHQKFNINDLSLESAERIDFQERNDLIKLDEGKKDEEELQELQYKQNVSNNFSNMLFQKLGEESRRQSIQKIRKQTLSPTDKTRGIIGSQKQIKKEEIIAFKDRIQKQLERGRYQDNTFLDRFRPCKQDKRQTQQRRYYHAEYILMRKRAKSQKDQKIVRQRPIALNTSTGQSMIINTEDPFMLNQSYNQNTTQGRSVEAKKKKLLAESVKFFRRINVMKQRRAQYFAPGIKKIDVNKQKQDHEYEIRVFQKRKIKIDTLLMDENALKKRVLYRSASTSAIFLLSEQEKWNQTKPQRPMPQQSQIKRDEFDEVDQNKTVMFEKDYQRIVEQEEKTQQQRNFLQRFEDVPDMDKILQDKDLKIVVKLSNIKYSSINDVLTKPKPQFMTRRQIKDIQKQKEQSEALKMKQPIRVIPRPLIIGFQKKVFVAPKVFHEDLLRNEYQDSDEDQDGMMARIEHEFNYDHRSHIFVTGTMSVVVNKPIKDSKILNRNYHQMIKELDYQKEVQLQQYQELLNSEKTKNQNNGKKRNSTQVSPVKRSNNNTNSTVSSIHRPKLAGSIKFNYSLKRSSFNNNFNSTLDGLSKAKFIPNPEPLTDPIILKMLNNDAKSSRLYIPLNITAYPKQVLRKDVLDKKMFKKKKGKKNQSSEDEKADSDGEIPQKQEKKIKIDYFLDRQINGLLQVRKARAQAIGRHKDSIEWSGQDVMSKMDPYKVRRAIKMLDSIRVWPYAVHGYVKKARVLLKAFMATPFVEHGMTCCVLGNTVVLSLDFYGASQTIQDICSVANTFFTLVFASEMGLRITAIGPQKWLKDKMNYMDGTIVLLSLVELVFMSGSGALSALRSVRIFRVFRVLRVARLLRGLKSMVQIINVIQRSISSFIYLAMLLLLFIFIYALLGMQIFGGAFTDPEVVGTVRYNYDSFLNAFITSFIMLTTENWNQIMFYAFSGTTTQALIAIYFVSCIFIGNWMLLNLFLAILLDSFAAVEEEDLMTPEKKERLKDQMILDLGKKEGEDFIEGLEELQKEGFNLKSVGKKKPKKRRKNGKQGGSKAVKVLGNILEESQEVDLYELARRDEEILEQRKQLFRGIECEMSIYLFSKQNWFRIMCYKILSHSKFETICMFLIVGSSFKLVFDTYTDTLPREDPIIVVSEKIDLFFQIAFTIEMSIKIIAFGFIMDEGSYLSESWSQMDCFIVSTGLIDTALAGVDIAFLKVLRLLRILRPLRFLSHSSSMKTLIEALMASLPSIANVGVVIVIVFLMFAILGVNLFAGKLQSCTVGFYKINNMKECFAARGKWKTFDQNMDNVVRAMMTLFSVSNNEGWPDVMYAYSDATGVETGPKPGGGLMNAFFFILFVFIGSFFFLNLFTGVLFLNFEKAQRDEKDAMLLDGDEVRWVDMMKMIVGEQPEIIKVPKNPFRKWCYNLVRDEGRFANFIMGCIIMNIFIMAATYEGQSDNYSNILEKINYFFTAAFAFECFSKLIAHGGNYFNSAWNKFDFFVVSASFLDIVMANMSANSLKVIRVGPQLARIMRVMRVSRLFKLLNKYKGLQALMQTITFSMPSVINAFALLFLVYFIFSVLAVFFFKDVSQGIMIDDYMNFSNFGYSLQMMLRLSTGEDWPIVMYDVSYAADDCIPSVNCGTPYAPLFFILFVLIQQYIMVDLFVLIILQQFDLYYLPSDNVLDRFKTDVLNFKYCWKKFALEFEGFKIRGNDVIKFFKELKGDLGMSGEKDKKAIQRNLVIMNIQADDDGFIYFNELLYKTMKRRYAPGRTKKKVLFELELKTLEILEKIMKEQVLASRKKERQKAVSVNPFLAMMYKSMSFNVWKYIYETNLPKRQQHIDLGLEREISDPDLEEDSSFSEFLNQSLYSLEGMNGFYGYETEEDVIIEDISKDKWMRAKSEREGQQPNDLSQNSQKSFRGRPFNSKGYVSSPVKIADQSNYQQLAEEDKIIDGQQ